MSENIYKLPQEELAEALVSYRQTHGVKTTKGDALDMVKDVFSVVSDLLLKEDVGITIGKVGLLYNGLQKGRTGRHPQTGETMTIPDKRTIKYKPAPKYKNKLNDSVAQ